jgi:hypothetical protein
MITVDCASIADILEAILRKEDYIDLVKIDTEGNEFQLVNAIPSELRRRIGEVVFEANDGSTRRA